MKQLLIVSMIVYSLIGHANEYSPLPESGRIGRHPKAAVPFDLDKLKVKWRQRISAIKENGVLPIIDIESSFNPGKLDAAEYAQMMDDNGIALTAFSPQIGKKNYKKKGHVWHDGARRAVASDPTRYIPTSTAGIYPVVSPAIRLPP